MGQSTNAILFYGYCWEEETDLFPGHEDGCHAEWAGIVLRKRGVISPWDQMPPYGHLPWLERCKQEQAWIDGHRQELDDWSSKQLAVEAEFGVEVDAHCSGNYPMPFVSAWSMTAYRGSPKEVDLVPLMAQYEASRAEWNARLDRFLAELGIDRPHPQPRWWLVSYWGC